MQLQPKSIRPFIGAKNYEESRNFYIDLGFEESVLSPDMCYFDMNGFGFYLQNAYIEEWVYNTMVFMEVADVQQFWKDLVDLNLNIKYHNVRIAPIRELDWGSECFVHDPSGVLWHFGSFNP